jgi:hypothetical protein
MLDSIISESENEFLDIGEQLQGFYTSAQDMCTQSGSIVEIMTGESLSKATEGLTGILDELKQQLEDSERHFGKITGAFEEHLSALNKISSHLEDLDMLVLNLSMLGLQQPHRRCEKACREHQAEIAPHQHGVGEREEIHHTRAR